MSLSDQKGTPGGFVCLVDGDGEYNLEQDKMTELIEFIDPKKDGSYTIVGIMGCQSTGKSTLLNRLFGTQFAMMNETVRRGQTTKGIWLDAARNTQNLMIADLEGTDSGERGEDRTTFERQTILYALAICEVLIINMWETDIGRYTASNHGILKTVFEVNMQLFKSKAKTQLLFIVRDYNEEGTPFSTLRSRLLREMQGIWDDIAKPAEFQDIPMTDCFDFKFTYLPHYIYRREKFEEMAKKLQEKFTDPNSPDSFFDTEYHHEKSRSIPSSDFAKYSESIWNTIKTNQDLNLPTQREMLATYRCDELVTQILTEYQGHIAPLREKAMTALVPTLGSELAAFIQSALGQYDTACAKYIQEVVQRKRVEFEKKLLEPVLEIIQLNMKLFIFNTLTQEYDAEINANVTPDDVSFGIMDVCNQKLKESLEKFKKMTLQLISGLEGYESLNHTIQESENDFTTKLHDLRNILRKSQLHALTQTTLSEFDARFDIPVQELFQNGKADLWQKVGELFNNTLTTSLHSVNSELESLADTDEERKSTKRKIIEAAEYIIFDKAQRFVHNLPVKIRDRFESLFVYHKGQLRTWKGSDDPRAIFENARDESLQLLRAFATFNLRSFIAPQYLSFLSTQSPSEVPGLDNEDTTTVNGTHAPGLSRMTSSANQQSPFQVQVQQSTLNNPVLINRDELYRIESDFERKIQGHLQNAILEVERIRTQTGLPPWVYALLLFLGYDEILWALSNPFVLFFLMLIGIGIFVLHQLHMTEPALQIAKAIGNRLLDEFTKAIDPSAAQKQPTQPQQQQQVQQQTPPAMERRSSAIEVNPNLVNNSELALDTSNLPTPTAVTTTTTTTATTKPSTSTTLAPPSLDLNNIPDDATIGNAAAAATAPPSTSTPRNILATPSNATSSEFGTGTLRRRPAAYTNMTMNKRSMAQMYAAGLDAGMGKGGE